MHRKKAPDMGAQTGDTLQCRPGMPGGEAEADRVQGSLFLRERGYADTLILTSELCQNQFLVC
jgi:hypothetical protein